MRMFSALMLMLVAATSFAQEGPALAKPLVRLGTSAFRQGEPVSAVAFSPDGKHFATVTKAYTAWLWNAQTGELLRRLSIISTAMNVAFAADSRSVYVGNRDGTIVAFAVEKAKLPVKYAPWTDGQFSIKYLKALPDGALLTVNYNKTVTRWDVKTRMAERKYSKHQGDITALAVSADGAAMVTASLDNTVRLWDIKTGRGSAVLEHVKPPVRHLALAGDGKILWTAGPDQPIRAWDLDTNQMLRQVRPTFANVGALALSPNGKLLVAVSDSGSVFAWDTKRDEELPWNLPSVDFAAGLAFSSDGKRLAIAGRELLMVECADGSLAAKNGHWGEVNHLDFSPSDETLVSAGTDRTLRIWRLPKGELTKTLRLPKDFDALLVRYTTNGQLLTGSAQGKLVLRDGQNGEEIKELASYAHGFKALALSPDGKFVAGGTAAGEIVVLAAATGKETQRWKGHSAAVLELAFFADSQTLAATDLSREVRVWDIQTGTQNLQVGPFYYLVMSLAVHPAGTFVAGIERERPRPENLGYVLPADWQPPSLTCFDLAQAGDKRPLTKGFFNGVDFVFFAPDGRSLYFGRGPVLVQIDHDTLKVTTVLAEGSQHGSWQAFAFAHNRKTLAVSSTNSMITLWDSAEQVKGPIPAYVTVFKKDLWDELAHNNAKIAYRAMVRLAEDPKTSVPLLRDRLLEKGKSKFSLVQQLRAVEALESVATPEAIAALDLIAQRSPFNETRVEAATASKRLQAEK